jgi:serine/threonine protein kinase
VQGSAKLTQQGTVVGSLTYIAPERLRGEQIDQRSDLYSIGVICYELLAGAPPFVAPQELDLVDMHLHDPPPPLPVALPASFQALLGRALAKHADERFATADAMAAALEAAARDLG